MRHSQLVVQSYAFRGARLWLLIRALIATVLLLAGGDPFRLPTTVTVASLVLPIAVCFLDTYRHHERALLGNLGVSPQFLLAMFAGPALLGELVVRIIAAAL